MQKTISILKVALKNIMGNKLRSSLTMLGLIIGIISVILLVGIGTGATSDVTSSVKSLGTDVLTVSISSDADVALEYESLDNFLNQPNVEKVAPYKTVTASVNYGENTSRGASILATTKDYLSVMNLTISNGRLLSNVDLKNASKVCMLGTDIVDTLFEDIKKENVIGKKIKIDGDSYTVIGIITKTGSTMGNNIDSTVIIPFSAAKYLDSDISINSLYIKVENEDLIENTTSMLESYLSQILDVSTEYIDVSSQSSMIDKMSDISSTLSLLLGGIAGISLVVGGIGVMNVMLVSVTERTKEIGIRKALGAKRSDILVQFLIEALVLCVIGGIIGIVLGTGIGKLLQIFGFKFKESLSIILISFLSSVIIGMVFGIFPAYKASKLNPIEALRSE